MEYLTFLVTLESMVNRDAEDFGRGRIYRGYQELSLEHVEFEMFIRHLSGNVRETVEYMNVKFMGEFHTRVINLKVISLEW